MDEQFYVYLPSNDPSFVDNKISNFRVQLAMPNTLRGKWEVALTHVSCFKSWQTFGNSKVVLRKMFGYKQPEDNEFIIHGIVANSEQEIIQHVNGTIETAFYTIEVANKAQPPSISFDCKRRKFRMTTGYGEKSPLYVVEFQDSLSEVLGFQTYSVETDVTDYRKLYDIEHEDHYTKADGTKELLKFKFSNNGEIMKYFPQETKKLLDTKFHEHIFQLIRFTSDYTFGEIETVRTSNPQKKRFEFLSHHPVTIENLYRNIFIYCDIVMPSFVGNTYTKLLRIVDVPPRAVYGEHINKQFDKLYYIPVAVNEFQTIEIDIKDEFNRNVAFEFGTCIVTLHFRRVK